MTTPTGAISKPYELLAILLANCATFQTAMGAANATEALARIHYPELDQEPDDPEDLIGLPWAIITEDDECQFSQDFTTGRCSGELKLTIELPIDEAVDEKSKTALFNFTNVLGSILAEMQVLHSTPNGSGAWYLTLTNLTKVRTPGRGDYKDNPRPNQRGNYFFSSLNKVGWTT